ncbi:hypothetical protein [Burkholderia phage vB_BpP_HN01]|nr:hypothetical protein [Burkholderia phage vB_BpP_HN01]
MTLAELYEKLSFGELQNLYEADEGSGVLRDDFKPKVVRHLNDALLRLYSRFALKESNLVIELHDHITNYHLKSKFAESQWETSGQDFLYIKDLTREPFTDDIIRILSVYNNFGDQIPLNDDTQPESVFSPQGALLQVPRPVSGQALSLVYQAKHPILYWDRDETEQEIEIPDVLEEALLAYVAHKLYSNKNTQEAQGIAQSHIAMYEAICQDVIDKDLVSTSSSTTNIRFNKGGWV